MRGFFDAPTIVAWGDSLTDGAGSNPDGLTPLRDYMSDLRLLTGHFTDAEGIGGNTSTQIAARMLPATAKHGLPTIIWAGRNNFFDATTVESDIASMVAALTTPDYVVLSVINAEGEGIGTTQYNEIIALNANLAATYGAHYLDVRSYLVSLYNPGDPTDVADHASDTPPTSLRYIDGIHLNVDGYQDVADYIYAHRAELGLP